MLVEHGADVNARDDAEREEPRAGLAVLDIASIMARPQSWPGWSRSGLEEQALHP